MESALSKEARVPCETKRDNFLFMKELIYPRLYLPAIKKFGKNTGIIDGAYQSDWDTHHERVLRLCNSLSSELGVSKKDRFAVMALNSHQFLELWHSAFLGAGIINPLNLRLAPKELAYILNDSGTEVIFTDQFFAPLITAAREELGEDDPIRHVVLIGEGDVQHDLKYEDLWDLLHLLYQMSLMRMMLSCSCTQVELQVFPKACL